MSYLSVFRSFTHFLTGVCAIIGGVFTGLCSPATSWVVMKTLGRSSSANVIFYFVVQWPDWSTRSSTTQPESSRRRSSWARLPNRASWLPGIQRGNSSQSGQTEKGHLLGDWETDRFSSGWWFLCLPVCKHWRGPSGPFGGFFFVFYWIRNESESDFFKAPAEKETAPGDCSSSAAGVLKAPSRPEASGGF